MPASMLPALPEWAQSLVHAAAGAGEDVPAALKIAVAVGAELPLPGLGQTSLRWAVLTALARANLTVARVVEAHTDALAIVAEAGGELPRHDSWGVFAAEAPGSRLTADVGPDGSATLTGTKPWCSLGDVLDCALVTAHVEDGRQLFRVDLNQAGVHADPAGRWVARGLRTVTSGPITFDAVPASAVGDVGWYLRRPGFAWGGMGVAACWHGGAIGLAETLRAAAGKRGGELNALHVGVVDTALHASAGALADAARRIDAGEADADRGNLLALRVRSVVADAAERVLRQVGRALGPGPLAFDADHAARAADLELYLRQHHAERDLAALGQLLLDERS